MDVNMQTDINNILYVRYMNEQEEKKEKKNNENEKKIYNLERDRT